MLIRITCFLSFLTLINFSSFANMNKINAQQFSFTQINGQKINLADLQGKVILVVNTASKCGFTPQYQGLQNLYEKYKDQGLVIIAVPSKDFANQEFNDLGEIEEFTKTNFSISFPLTEISKVKGNDAHPFYIWANKQAGFFGSPKWNFHKYLIDKNGNFAAWYSSTTKPEDDKIVKKIKELL